LPPAFGGSTVQEQVGDLTCHDPFGCDQNQFYMFIAYLVHQVSCIHCVFHCREEDDEACLYHYSQEHMTAYLCAFATAKGVHTSGEGCKVYLPDKRDQEHMSYRKGSSTRWNTTLSLQSQHVASAKNHMIESVDSICRDSADTQYMLIQTKFSKSPKQLTCKPL